MKRSILACLLLFPALIFARGVYDSSGAALGGAAVADIDLDTGGYQLVIDAGTLNDPAIVFGDDDDGSGTGIYRHAADTIGIGTGGTRRLLISTEFTMYANIDVANKLLYDSSDQLDLGTACTDGHSGATGDVCVGADLQVDGPLFADGLVATTPATATLADGATTIAVTTSYIRITGDVGGNEVINTITGGVDGQRLVIQWIDGLWDLDDVDAGTANTCDLVGTNTDFVGTSNDTLELIFDGTNWHEVGRSVN